MKKKFTYLLLVGLFVSASAFVVIRYNIRVKNNINAFYPLQERKGINAASAEWVSVKDKASDLIRIVRENPQDIKSALALASLYLQESRITGNSMYYDAAALKYVNDVLKIEPENFEALTLKALINLSQHHFAEALVIAQKAQEVGPYNAFVYGLLVDGNVEMGNYKAAIENAEKMISLRPDIRSYSRISYLREIHGDFDGAIEAMQRAVKAGGYGDEPTAWARVQLAKLYELTGDLKSAEMHYTIVLDHRPGYAYAIAGLGNLAMANQKWDEAIKLYEQADSLLIDYSFKEQLAKLYLLKGNSQKAKQLMNVVIENMSKEAEAGERDEDLGHYSDKELAYAYLLAGEKDKALRHALAEYNRRPDNIEVNETVAWVYYKRGEVENAVKYIAAALKTGSKHPELLTKAALIYAKAGQQQKAKQLQKEALVKNPVIDISLKSEAVEQLGDL